MLFCNLLFQFQIVFFANRDGADSKHGVETIHTLALQTVIGISHGLLVKVFQNVLYNLGDTFLRSERFLGINSSNLLILLSVFFLYRIDIVNAERQNISVIDGVNDGVCMEFIAECLLSSFEIRISASTCIDRENRSARKAKDVIVSKVSVYFNNLFTLFDLTADNSRMHVTELASMAFVKYQNDMLIPDGVHGILLNKDIQLLNCGYDNSRSRVLKLFLQNRRALIAVGCALFKSVILFDGLIVQVFTVNNKQDLINVGQVCSKLCRLERGEGFATARSMPDISACFDPSGFLAVGRCLNSVQDAFCCNDLIRTHDKQQFLGCKHAILGQNIQQGMLGKERLCKVNKVCNNSVVTIRPIGSELKAIGCFLAVLFAGTVALLDMARSGGIGIILGEGAVGDDKNLHILIKPRPSPKAVSLIAINLVESFLDRNTTALQLHVNQRQTVHKNGHVIPGVVIAGTFFILIDDL